MDYSITKKRQNVGEAYLVLGHIKRLLRAGVQEEDIGIITPYADQVLLLKKIICPYYRHIAIDTVDSFQGQEKEAIIYSCVRSNCEGLCNLDGLKLIF